MEWAVFTAFAVAALAVYGLLYLSMPQRDQEREEPKDQEVRR